MSAAAASPSAESVVVDDLERIQRRAVSAIWRRFALSVVVSAVISALLFVAAGSAHGGTVHNRRQFGSFDLGMSAADSVAITVGLMLLATTINIALAALSAPDTGSEQVSADTWRVSLNGVTFVAAILAMVIGETQFGVKGLPERWATSATCLIMGLMTGVIAAAGSWRATYESVRDVAALRLERRIYTLRAARMTLLRAAPMARLGRRLANVIFVIETVWLSILCTMILLIAAVALGQRFPWQFELGLILASAAVVTPLQLVLVWSQPYKLTGARRPLLLLRLAFAVYGSTPVAIALASLIDDNGRNYGPLLFAYACSLHALPLAAWALRRRLPRLFVCLDEIGLRSLDSDLKYCLARHRQQTD